MWSAAILQNILGNVSFTKIVVILLCLTFLYILWTRRYSYYLSWILPGPFALPILGNFMQVWHMQDDLIGLMNKIAESYPDPLRVWLGPFLLVCVKDPQDVQLVTCNSNSIQKPVAYRFAKMWIGNGLFTAPYRLWHKERKMIEQTFNVPVLDSYMNVFNRDSLILVNELKQHANTNQHFDIWHFTCRCTLDIVGKTMMGINLNCQLKNKDTNAYGNEYMKSTAMTFKLMYDRMMFPWLMNDYLFKFSNIYKDMMKCIKVMDDVTSEVISSRYNRADILQKNGLTGQKTMIDELLRENKLNNLSDGQLRDHLNTMVATGADATGNMLAYVFLLLAMHPEVQERLYQEIHNEPFELENDDLNVTRHSFKNMPYLDCVVKETLRLFPISPFIGRYTTGDIKLKSCDLTIKKGTTLIVGIQVMQRNKDIWGEDAHVYNPDRFLLPHDRHPSSFVPFSAGQRNCVGYKYALWSMKVITIHVLRAYKLSTDEKFSDIKCYFNILLKKIGGWNMKIEAR